MNQNIIFKIKLTPLEQFFFGGETVFGGEGGQGERRRSYLVKSNLLPQQTSLLGLLREQLLTQNGLLLDPKSTPEQEEKAIKAVGVTGFLANQDVASYGVINGLSPLVIEDAVGAIWKPSPLDDQQMDTKTMRFEMDTDADRAILRDLDPKSSLEPKFGNQTEVQPLDSFFKESAQVGITMTNRVHQQELTNDDLNEAFYRQTFRKNSASEYATIVEKQEKSETFSFVFWVKMDASVSGYSFHDNLITLGGERSLFKMEVTPADDHDDLGSFIPPVQYKYDTLNDETRDQFIRVVLMNDSYVNWQTIKDNSVLIVANIVPFRYFNTYLGKTQQYYDFNEKSGTTKQQSKAHTLLQRGGVIYCKRNAVDAITNHIDSFNSFKKIGYNYYKTL